MSRREHPVDTPQYKAQTSFEHGQRRRTGVLITNLGTPDQPEKKALRRYLKEFLSDPRVVEVPRLLWWCILNLVILNIRPARSAKAYKTVWTDRGSPLLFHTEDQCKALERQLQADFGEDLVVDFAMRYGNPSITSKLTRMQEAGVEQLIVLPLYPQYCAATSGSTFDAIAADFTRRRWLPALQFINCYHDFDPFIAACASQIQAYWAEHGRSDKLLLSYHGIPARYLSAGDPYHCHCHKTSRLIAQKLGLAEGEYLTTFQSRFGREPWLKPYTDMTLKSLAAEGVASVQVFCPGFAADCLETIEEIGEENRHYFIEAGGKAYGFIPCLNAEPAHVEALSQLVGKYLAAWQTDGARPQASDAERKLQRSLAQSLPDPQ
ncbi:ferrochelatase [Allohahella marinimesophila]|uniref:Ferrochelatase n=1 Tax=Allohahella marinimesophila TaxID=1054972 RepID=A0ABP7PR05_9GAMM